MGLHIWVYIGVHKVYMGLYGSIYGSIRSIWVYMDWFYSKNPFGKYTSCLCTFTSKIIIFILKRMHGTSLIREVITQMSDSMNVDDLGRGWMTSVEGG